MVRFSPEPIDPAKVYYEMGKDGSGSVLLHFAVAKATGAAGGVVTHIVYRPDGDVLRELESIADEMRCRWEITDVLLVRRQGKVAAGEIISLVAVSSPGSEAAFEACSHGLARLKKMSSISKTEFTA
jgi:molybdopterin synthase catalytic subunit